MLRSALNSGTHNPDNAADTTTGIFNALPDHRGQDPAEQVMTQNEVQLLSEMLNAVDEREAKILRMRYGIGTDHPMTLSEIGEKLGLTRERIRQIENDALHTLQDILTQKHGYKDDS
jgi:RNA polymerase primary sigma factor